MTIDTQEFVIPLYTVFLISSIVIGFIVAIIILLKNKVSKNAIICSAVLNIVLIIYFSLLYTFAAGALQGKRVFGFSGMGGLIGMLTGSFITCRLFKEPLLLKAYCAVTPLIYAISKLGCFFAGCCGGIEYHGFGAVKYIGEADYIMEWPTLPVPMLETIAFTIIFIVMMVMFNRLNLKKYVTLTVIICAIVKTGLDFLRQSHVKQIISLNQVFCILVVLVIFVGFYLFPKMKHV